MRIVKGRFDAYRVEDEPLQFPAGRSRIYAVEGRPDLYYKEFYEPCRGARELARIEELVEVGAGLAGATTPSPSRERIAWPRDFVLEGGSVVGVVIPFAGEDFYRERRGEMLMPRGLSYLRRPDVGLSSEVRLRLMKQLAGVLRLLEHADLVHGDISAQNVLWSPPPRASIVLIDCDGMHRSSVEGSEATTDGWADPRKENGEIASHDMRSDWFALALAIWRVTVLSTGAPTLENGRLAMSSRLPAALVEPIERTFADDTDAGARPSPGEWIGALDAVLGSSRARRLVDNVAPISSEQISSIDPAALFEYRAVATPTPPNSSPGAKASRRGGGTPPLRPSGNGVAGSPPAAPRRRRWFSARRVVFLAAALAVAGVLVRGCSTGGPSGSEARAEAAIARWTKSSLDTRGVTARCPGDSSLHAGAHYVCGVETRSGGVARVYVRIGDDRGIRRRIHVFVYRRRAVLDDIRARYDRQRRRGSYGLAEISCPATFPARSGTEFRCPARFTDGARGKISVHLFSRRGLYEWREVGTPVGALSSLLR